MVHHRAGWLNPVFEGLTYAGRLGLLWIAIALVLGAVWRRWGVLALTVIAVALADWSAIGLKALADAPGFERLSMEAVGGDVLAVYRARAPHSRESGIPATPTPFEGRPGSPRSLGDRSV